MFRLFPLLLFGLFLVPGSAGAEAIPVQMTRAIDFSQLDVLLGLAVGIVVTGALIVLVLWALVKAQVIRFGKPQADGCGGQANSGQGVLQVPCIPTACVEHIAEKQRSLSNEENIKKLWEKFDALGNTITSGIQALQANQTKILLGLVQGGHLPKNLLSDLDLKN
jgi:hypothetical protein